MSTDETVFLELTRIAVRSFVLRFQADASLAWRKALRVAGLWRAYVKEGECKQEQCDELDSEGHKYQLPNHTQHRSAEPNGGRQTEPLVWAPRAHSFAQLPRHLT